MSIDKTIVKKDEMYKMAKELFGLKDFTMKVRSADGDPSLEKKGAVTTDFVDTQFYSPRLTPDTWWLPRTRKMLLRWAKIFYDWDPYVNSILRMHARYPISEFNFITDDMKQKEFFENVLHQDDWDIIDVMREGSLSWQKNGESICMGDWDDKLGLWKGFTWLDPGLIEIEEIPFSGKVKVYSEIPKKYINLLKSNKANDTEKKKLIPEVLIEAINKGQKYIELATEERWIDGKYTPATVCVMVNKSDVGENGLRGLPPMTCILKTLVYQDHLRKAQMSRAQRFAYPIEFWKLGDVSNNILPDAAALKEVQKMLTEALASPPFSIIYTPLLSLEVIGAVGSLLPIYEDLNYCEDQILVGLGTNKNIVLGEGGWMSNAKTLSIQRLIMDYQADREMWDRKFLRNFVLRPMCIRHGWVEDDPVLKKKKPRIPKISWTRSLDIQHEEDTKRLYMDMWKDGIVSTETLFSKFPDLDLKTEVRNIEKERGTILDGGTRKLPSKNVEPMNFGDGKEEEVVIGTPIAPNAPLKPKEPTPEEKRETIPETKEEGGPIL